MEMRENMIRILSILVFCASALVNLVSNAAIEQSKFKVMNSKDLQREIQAKKKNVFIYDVNMDSLRTAEGVIPGAKALDGFNTYALTTLPKEKDSKLIFYCASEQCTASHDAAKRAMSAGYQNVFVMTDGIFGWKKAGHKTAKFE